MQHRHIFPVAGLTALIVACSGGNDPAYRIETLVPGSALHSPNGITFGPDGGLYAGSVSAQTIYRIDVATGEVETIVPAPAGEADDIAFAPDGSMVWTALIGGEIRQLTKAGDMTALVSGKALINPVHFTADGRLFAAQIGFDRLYEFPLGSDEEPRLVASKIGNLNSFEITADDRLFGPLSNLGTVAQIDIETGSVTPIAENLGKVVAVNLDSQGRVWAIDWASGNLWRIDPIHDESAPGWREPQLVATLVPPLDNLAIGPDDAVYVSRPAHSAIDRVDPDTGERRPLVSGHLAAPGGLAIMSHAGHEALLLADGYGYRVVDTHSGAVTTTFDLTEFGFPGAASDVAVNDKFFALTSAITRPRVYLADRSSGKTVHSWTGLKAPYGIVMQTSGDPIVADFATGTLVGLSLADKKQKVIIAENLDGPVGLAWAGPEALYVSETLAGTVAHIEIRDGSKTLIGVDLLQPEGLTVMADGRIAVVEVGRQRLVAIDPGSGETTVLAEDLPVGNLRANAPEPVYTPSGVAQGADGSLYVSGDLNNSVLKVVLK
jgi:sugar lactone lactonase YvrE